MPSAPAHITRLKFALWLLAAAPLADLAWRTFTHQLGTNPQETLLRATGTWGLVLLLVTLGVTPLRQWWKWQDLILVRRMLGLWAFVYAAIHLSCFWAFEHGFIWLAVLQDGLKRPFVTVGLLAFFLMLLLAMTSNKRSMRTLGPRWKKLHRAVYVIAVLSCLHFFLHRAGKNNFLDPMITLAVIAGLFSARIFFAQVRK